MTVTTTKAFTLAALIVFIITAICAYLVDTISVPHLIGGLAIGCAVLAAGGLVA